MAQTRFTGPVVSDNGFVGDVTGDVTGTITSTSNVSLTGTANVIVLPTSDPGVAGAVWNNGGAFAISAG